jgi:hypothetical protein
MSLQIIILKSSVADPYHVDVDSDADPASHFHADQDPACHFMRIRDPTFQIKAQNLENVLK